MYPKLRCIDGSCTDSGMQLLEDRLKNANEDVFHDNINMTWRKWCTRKGKSAPEKCLVKGTFSQAVTELLTMLKTLNPHLFRANWNRHLFEYIRNNIVEGYVVQIFDFAMNYRNAYQDKVQSAYWEGMQTCIHAVINYFLCPNDGCNDTVTLVLAQITDDLKHDSFVACAGHEAAFKYLAMLGTPTPICHGTRSLLVVLFLPKL